MDSSTHPTGRVSRRAADPFGLHQHSSACWWDHRQARWTCPAAIPTTTATPRPAGGEGAPVDVRDMLVVHTALLREFRLAPDAIARVPVGDMRRAASVEAHLGLLCDLLHHHHEGEDELLWPPLSKRLPAQALAQLEEVEAQHAGLDAALGRVGAARRRWVERVDAESSRALIEALRTLHHLLAEHLDTEERTMLPLASVHLSAKEWKAVGEAGAAAIATTKLPLVFGMFAYEGDPDVVAGMLQEAPAPARLVISLIAPRLYARRATQLYGTPRP